MTNHCHVNGAHQDASDANDTSDANNADDIEHDDESLMKISMKISSSESYHNILIMNISVISW